MKRFKTESTAQLLRLHSIIMDELFNRNIVRTSNNPTGNYAETLFHRAFGWKLTSNSNAGFDAEHKGLKYEIKSRRKTRRGDSRQLGAIRNLKKKKFDYLACVLFEEDYSIKRAAITPRRLLTRIRNRYSKHVNAQLFHLDDDVWNIAGVKDVTSKLRRARRAMA